MNFLALLGWAPDGETTIMSPDELVERFSLDRVGSSPATLDYEKLDWMNGVYLRALPPEQYADRLLAYLREQGFEWPEERIRAAAPLVQAKIERLGQFPEYAGFLFEREGIGRRIVPSRDGYDRGELDPEVLAAAADTLAEVEPFTAEAIEEALRSLSERLGQQPRQAFRPIRMAVTGSKVSPGLFESIELLGRDETLARIKAARGEAA
jgi:glutamyl-tRNA synthetase